MNQMLGSFKPLSILLLLLFAIIVIATTPAYGQGGRTLRVIETTIERETEGIVAIEMDVLGDENTVGFSVNFNPAQLSLVSVALAPTVPGGTSLLTQEAQAQNGRVGVALGLAAGTTFTAGTRRLVNVTFRALTTGESSAMVSFGDQPIPREFVTPDAGNIPASSVALSPGIIVIYSKATTASAASYSTVAFAPESIVAVFGTNLATDIAVAGTIPLPTSLLGTTIRFVDSAGVSRDAPLFFVSPSQCNYQIPAGTAPGNGHIIIVSGDKLVSMGNAFIAPVAPGIFTANVSGTGVPAAQIFRFRGQNQTIENVATFQPGPDVFVPIPIDMGPAEDVLILVLYGTGLRFNTGTSGVTVTIGGTPVPVAYANVTPGFEGLDQVNVGALPRSLVGRGLVNVVVTVDGFAANTVTIEFK